MHKKKITPTGALLYVFLTVVLVFMMIPFVWLLISSLRPNADLFNEPFAVPKTLSFENFRAVMESHPMLFVLCKFGCHCNDCHGNSCWGGYACRLRYAAEIFNKEESDGIIFHVPFYSYQCIYGAILCYD